MKKACVLTSGGIESSVLLWDALKRYDLVTPLYIRCGLHWEEVELFWLKHFFQTLRTPNLLPIKIIDDPLQGLYGPHWSVTGIGVPGRNSGDESMYLPGRNIMLISKAACFAALNRAGFIEIGVLKSNQFSDATPAFFSKMAEALSLGLGAEIGILAPFQQLTKPRVISLAQSLALDLTFSCANPQSFDHCGECNKCLERKGAFLAAGVADRTKYRKIGNSQYLLC